MSTEQTPSHAAPEQETFTIGELVQFITQTRDAIAKTIAIRTETADSFRNGTDEEWRAVGYLKSKAERVKVADMYTSIANTHRNELALYNAVLDVLTKHTP